MFRIPLESGVTSLRVYGYSDTLSQSRKGLYRDEFYCGGEGTQNAEKVRHRLQPLGSSIHRCHTTEHFIRAESEFSRS